jgi:predicted transcriptional regulator
VKLESLGIIKNMNDFHAPIAMTNNSETLESSEDCVISKARLDYLRKMIALLKSNLVFTRLDDRNFVSFGPNDDCQLAYLKMDSKNIDYAPILKNGVPHGYIIKKDLVNVRGKTCGEVAKEVTEKNRISPNFRLENTLESLVDEPFLFVVENRCLRGIITIADLNKRAFRTLFYIVLSELESLLLNLIRTVHPCENYLHLLSENRVKDVLYNYWKAKTGNVEISVEQHLSFSDIINIILKSKDIGVWPLLGCTSKKEVEQLSSLVDLRNNVMHSTRSFLDKEGDISHIKQQYKRIWELIEDLLENEDLDEDDILIATFDGKNQDFRFILKSGAIVRTPLNDPKGKELEELGIEKLRKFLTSRNGRKIDKNTMRRLNQTIVFNELFKQCKKGKKE